MAILWCRAVSKGGGQGDRGANHFHTKYILRASSPTELRAAVLNCGLLPVYGSPHPENMSAFCVKIDVERNSDNPYLWQADAEWNTVLDSGRDPSDQQKQPDLRRPKWRAQFTPFPMARFVDYDGKLLADKAGTPFDPVPDMPIYVDEITIVQYEPQCNRAAQRAYMGCANTDTWLGAEPGTALVDDISVDEEFIQGAYWFLTTYRILVKPKILISLRKGPLDITGRNQTVGGWNPEYILNAGPYKLEVDSTTGKWSKKTISNDNWCLGRPAFLKEDGTEIKIDENTGALSDYPVFLQFQTKQSAVFAYLNLVPPPGWI